MKNVEELFEEGKAQMDRIQVPDELEMRLRNALEKAEPKPQPLFFYQRQARQFKIALVLVLALLIGFNYNAIASYGKQLFGYDQVMDGTLRELNELGKGQLIGKSHTFPNGVSLTVDYVMLDENQLLLFYTVKAPAGDVTNALSPFMSLQNLFGESRCISSQGRINEEESEVKYIASFEPPSSLARKLTLNFALNGQGVSTPAEITFALDRNTAMGHTIKKDLNQTIVVDQTELKFQSIVASPTQTVIKGAAQSIFGLAIDTLSGERFRPTDINLRLIANGEAIEVKGRGLSTDMKGITFHTNFDALPASLHELKLELVSFSADHDVNQQYSLNREEKPQVLDMLGQQVEINQIETTHGETLLTLTSEESVVLTKVYLLADGQQIALEETINDDYVKSSDGTIKHQRTLRFLGTGKDLQLDVRRMTYSKNYNKVINIPLD
ncbi:DUF4179 domain-containing protein [Desulfitobacterium hafniense]|uniref:DUF4179 domain-containing protein n=2 Tax=Desulfitobacterium hafniense TaxID=49338 RepID=A0A0W1JCX5_DESHA|nr:DUF4179 domain-containing protein [Desulfitobacterium hafniense]ACL21614.1 conserved hypothetical protein [Desulfitobacterium hafniense DCB-2]KTE89729.1 hypothetical protein AT727_10285 [Desulfitobacterium hafniense]